MKIQVIPMLTQDGVVDYFMWQVWDGQNCLYTGRAYSEESAFDKGETAARNAKWAREFGIKTREVS